MSAALEPGLRVRCVRRYAWEFDDGSIAPGPEYGTFWTIRSVQRIDLCRRAGDYLSLHEWTLEPKQVFHASNFEPEGERGLEVLRAVLKKLPAQAPEHAL